MILFGWNKTTEKDLGEYNDSGCALCGQGVRYALSVRRTFFTLLFIPVICYRTEYLRRCISCGTVTQLSKVEANSVIEDYFQWYKAKRRFLWVKLFVGLAAVLAGVIAMILSPYDDAPANSSKTSPQKVKALVPDEDGWYEIYNQEEQLVAEITVENGTKRVDTYYEIEPYTGEDITIDHEFIAQSQYYERQESDFVYYEDEAIVVIDEHDVGVKYYWYDTFEDELYWDFGVADINQIQYDDGFAQYIFTSYLENNEKEYYTRILQKDARYEVIMTYYNGQNQYDFLGLVQLDLYEYGNSSLEPFRTSSYEQGLELSPDNTIDEIVSYLEDNLIQADAAYQYTYYKDTSIIQEVTCEYWDPATDGITIVPYTYDIWEEDGYYITKLVE